MIQVKQLVWDAYTSKLLLDIPLAVRNEIFHGLSDVEKRKEIALDALRLLIDKVIFAGNVYWSSNLHELLTSNAEKTQTNLCDTEKIVDCEVCAKGALMLSRIRLGNNISLLTTCSKNISQGSNVEHFFDDYEWTDIERVYETWGDYKIFLLEDGQSYYRYHTPEMLANILCNIIVNGHFDVKDRRDFLIDGRLKKVED